jgi:hypothetical protein
VNATQDYETWILQTVQGGWFKELGPSIRALTSWDGGIPGLVELDKQLIDVAPFLAELDKRLCPANCRALRGGARGVLVGYQNAREILRTIVAGWLAVENGALLSAVQGMMRAGEIFTTALDLSVMIGDGGPKQ